MTIGTETTPAPPALSHRQILTILFGLMAGMLLAALDQSIVGTALPRIVSDLGGLDKLSWVVTAYLLTSTASTPLWGKISDLYGRRLIFQCAIGTFLVGSVLAGLSQNMTELIAFRAVQGIGGGGLLSIALAVIGDVIPPRERGRYQGYFGAVFGISSVAGPLLGGFFTDGPGWRWIFYVNLPIGLAALIITSVALKIPTVRREHTIDYLGAAIIVAGVTSLLLYLDWAGNSYGWASPFALALVLTAAVMVGLFVLVESRAVEPIIPLRLFRNRTFSLGSLFSFVSGTAMFGAIIYLPLFLQAVKGMTATMSGLAMLPAVAGIFATSISSGRMISKTGRYRIYPIVGAVTLIAGILALSTVAPHTPYWQIACYAFVFGGGLGFTMQTITTAVQNSVEMRDMGSATSSVTFFRSMGGAIGTAVLGAVLSNRLAHYLAAEFANLPGGRLPGSVSTNNVAAIQHLPEAIKTHVVAAFAHALDDVFLTAVPFLAIGLLVALFLPELPLRAAGRPDAPAPSDPAARPAGNPAADSAAQPADQPAADIDQLTGQH